MTICKPCSLWMRAISVIAIGFGVLTIKEGGAVLVGNEAALAAAGNYVPFVVWFNFVAGFAYVVAGVGLWRQRRWAAWMAFVIAMATALVFAVFGVYIFTGGVHEMRTVIAMSMRTIVWVIIAVIALLRMSPSPFNGEQT